MTGQRRNGGVSMRCRGRRHRHHPNFFPSARAGPPSGDAAMTERINPFLRDRRKRVEDGPCLVLDLDVVRENYLTFAKALPDTRVYYAVKANPEPEVLALLAGLGSSFDTGLASSRSSRRSRPAPRRIASASATRSRRSATSPAPMRSACGSSPSIARPRSRRSPAPRRAPVFCRILCDGAGAEWPLSRKFGCAPEMAAECAGARAPARPGRARGCRSMSARSSAIRAGGTGR